MPNITPPTPQNTNNDNAEWMVVYVTHNMPEAHIVAGRLEHEGVKTIIHSPIGGNALGITIGSLGEISLLVRPEDYELALDILEPDITEELPEGDEDILYYDGEDGEDD